MDSDNIDRASKYLDASRINQENLWKRRQIEWKTSFALWSSIALISGLFYHYIKHPILYLNGCVFFGFIISVYVVILFLHWRHLKAITISNNKDLEFINYFISKANWELDKDDFKEKPQRPKWAGGDVDFKLESDKLSNLYTYIAVTFIIEVFSIIVFLQKFSES